MKQRIVVVALIEKDGCYLFGKQNGGFSPGKLVLPGGGIEIGEYPDDAVKREVLEETGVTVKNLKRVHFDSYIGPYKGEEYHLTFLQYTMQYESGEPKPADDLTELMWLSRDEILHHPQNDATLLFLKAINLIQ